MFLGTFTPRLDDKARLFMPARFREELGDEVVITKGQERCLYVFSRPEFTRRAEEIRQGQGTDRDARNYARLFFASAALEAIDKQGRVTLPQPLRTYAGLDRHCTVIGNNTRIEIWEATAWEAYLAGIEDSFADSDSTVLPGLA